MLSNIRKKINRKTRSRKWKKYIAWR